MTYNIYRNIFNNLPYYIKKSDTTIIYKPKNIIYSIIYKKKKKNSILIRNLRHFLTKIFSYIVDLSIGHYSVSSIVKYLLRKL